MQNTYTGDLVPLPKDLIENIPNAKFGSPFDPPQETKDAAIPIREHQGATFYVGEIVEVKGARFRVNGITRKRIYLDSLPS